MKRRDLLKALSLVGGSVMVPSLFASQARMERSRAMVNAKAIVLGEINYVAPAVGRMPKYINIFLYGGPSELGGNLSNIEDINANSQNKYATNLTLQPGTQGSIVTPNYFWGGGNNGAGGEVMELMLNPPDPADPLKSLAPRMSIYRTINRIKDDSKAHRPSIFSNLTGVMGDEDTRPGVATILAAILAANNVIGPETLFPFVTFEGESVVFNPGDLLIPPGAKPISLDENLKNPFSRANNSFVSGSNTDINDPAGVNAQLETLAMSISTAQGERYSKVLAALTKRNELDSFITTNLAPKLATGVALPPDIDTIALDDLGQPVQLAYPATNFGRRLKSAVTLATSNPDTLFISLGSGGLGGWDDHDSAVDVNRYPQRLRELMQALNVAAKHLEALDKNVFITVYGDFGRNVNLNGSMGWDHGNNQNLYTVGGSNIEGRQLGKLVGKTKRIGDPNVNRQFTSPTDDSYQCEPFAISSTVYKYFGVQNPEYLTGEAPIDENAPNELI